MNNFNFAEQIERRKNPNKEFNSTARFLLVLLAVMVCVTITFTQIFNGVVVIGDSMKDTLHDGDYLYMQVNYSSLHHGDIIVIKTQDTESGEEKYLIKRLIGLPGDSLYAENGMLYRKDAGTDFFYLVVEDYLYKSWTDNIASSEEPLVLGENAIFFMGDNRNNSNDSRKSYKNLKKSDIVGIVTPWSIACKGFLTKIFNIF